MLFVLFLDIEVILQACLICWAYHCETNMSQNEVEGFVLHGTIHGKTGHEKKELLQKKEVLFCHKWKSGELNILMSCTQYIEYFCEMCINYALCNTHKKDK